MKCAHISVLLGLLLLGACGKPVSDKPGLILARSDFKQGVPSPAAMMILRNTGSEWDQETLVAPERKETYQLGKRESDGKTFLKRIDKSGKPEGGPLHFSPATSEEGGWTIVSAADVHDDDVHWIIKKKSRKPKTKTYEMAGGNVFHKCMWFQPTFGEAGILTISANMPYLQIWRGGAGAWEAETLWTAEVGGREQRLRDVEVGDLDGDGQDELVVVTHDLGAIYVLEQTATGFEAQEVHRAAERTFVHEAEIGDLDGDGNLEFYTTPSEPNRFDGSEQAGGIDSYRWNSATSTYDRKPVAILKDRHAKEILVVDQDGDGKSELYAALEAEGLEGENAVVILRRWVWSGSEVAHDLDVSLEGSMCRFLNLGDTNGDGVKEIIASTKNAGIFAAFPKGNAWVSKKLLPGFVSGGFEHATVVMDWDGDGKDELFVASDSQKSLNLFRHVDDEPFLEREELANFAPEADKEDSYFIWNIMPLPAGK